MFDRRRNIEYVKPHELWRLIINEDESLEVELKADNSRAEVTFDENCFHIHFTDLTTHTGNKPDIVVVVKGRIIGEDLKLEIEIENNSRRTIRECHFPIIELSDTARRMALHNSNLGGSVWPCLDDHLDELNDGLPYKGMDYIYRRKIHTYPGASASTNSFALADGSGGVYFGCHDPGFKFTSHIIEMELNCHLNLLMIQYPFLETGEKTCITGFNLSAYQGSWHKAADKYRAWADSWYEFKPVPDAIRHMQGWQRLIMRSQYGENFFTFPQLPQIFDDGIKAGIDTLFMFGWHQGGHDCDYPAYTPSEELGGAEVLRTNIAGFKKRGGKVILYANGQLIDKNSDYYLNGKGGEVSIKDHRGNEPLQFYGFSGRGVFNRKYGNRTFVTACPCCTDWHEQLKKVIDTASSLGCDGVFFDQLGAESSLCCDPAHGHPIPHFGIMNARRDMIAKLYHYAASMNPPLHFGIEMISDITAQHCDYIHTLAGGSAVVNKKYMEKGEKPVVMFDLSWFRYIFPEVVISNREIRDGEDVERRVNRMIMQNLFSDVEIFRCQKTIAEIPAYQEYLAMANAFRKKHATLLQGARFRSTSLHEIDNSEMDSEGHIAPNSSIVIIVTQSHLDSAEAHVKVPGHTLQACNFMGNGRMNPDGSIWLKRHGLALLVFR